MNWQRVVIAAVLLLTATGCSSVSGSGAPIVESRAVTGFSAIELSGIGDVQIEQTGTDTLSIQAQRNLLPYLTSEVTNGVLRLGTKQGVDITATEPITYRLTVRQLTGLGLSGSGNEHATGIVTTSLTVDSSGSGDITIDGTVDNQNVSISGSGDYGAEKLISQHATAQLSGSGDATVTATATLQAVISGSGDLNYFGNPTVTSHTTGSGDLRQRPSR